MATGSQDPVLSVLDDIGLRNLVDNFKKQKVTTLQTCKQLSDNELSHLGLTTIGDRARFRAEVQSYQPTTPTSQGESTSTLRTFLPSRSGNRFHRGKKDLRRKTWTANVMCLSDVNQTSVPSHSEKVCLQKASLGIKKISFDASGSESDVHDTLLNEFPKLSSSGGFELMYCAANKRELKKIDVKWDVPHLKTVLGGQSRVYVRPIQNSLSLDSDKDEDNATHTLEYSCQTCGSSFSVDELRSHIADCKTKNKTSREETFQEQEEDVITNDILEPHLDMNIPLLHASIDNTDLYFLETNLATADPGIVEWQTPRVSLEVAERPEDITKSCIDDLTNFQISDPIHALRYIRSKIVCGRKLEIEEQDLATGLTGDVNFIVVDRQNILTTGMEEIESLQNLRLTLDVQFYGETAQDYGGPRKEFFSLILPAIQEKYFDPIRNWVDVEEYKTVGKILALSMLQNGKLPRLLNDDDLQELFGDSPRNVLVALGKGLDALGMYQIMKAHPFMQHLMTPVQDTPFTLKMAIHLLKPSFSPEGSNQRSQESTVYQKFIKYLREIAGGRRQGIHLGMVLKFVTGAEMEPPLGFGIAPSVSFERKESLLPTANTCTNSLTLALPNSNTTTAEGDELFSLYDYAFCNTYFGLI